MRDTLVVTTEPSSHQGFIYARLQREMDDGCSPHVLTSWIFMATLAARKWAKDEGADYRENNA